MTAQIINDIEYDGVFTPQPKLKSIDDSTQLVVVSGYSIGEIKKVKVYGDLIYWSLGKQLYRTPEEAGIALLLKWVENLNIKNIQSNDSY